MQKELLPMHRALQGILPEMNNSHEGRKNHAKAQSRKEIHIDVLENSLRLCAFA
tara:strand:- start:1468 stop:1629 length:162 start_codon:yes stop_codon:yes gene_type:complete